MPYQVKGLNRKTGEASQFILEVETEQEALAIAAERGFYVESLRHYRKPLASSASPAAQPVEAPSVAPKANGFAIASFVLGLVGLLTPCGFTGVPILLAIVFGHIGRTQINSSGGSQGGRNLAISGIVLGYSAMVLVALLFAAWILFVGSRRAASMAS